MRPRQAPRSQPSRSRSARRRTAILAAGLGLAAALAGFATWAMSARRSPVGLALVRSQDQNVLLVTIDTLRADALGSTGGVAATPTLDSLAARGARFEFAHAHAVVTLPSHASILTGLYPYQHGIRDNSGFRLPPTVRTLAEDLRAHGFATGAFVGAFPLDARFGLDRGFDVYDEAFGAPRSHSDLAIPERRADAVVTAALAWIGTQRGRWFAWVHLYDPHAPYTPPPPFQAQYAANPYAGEVAFTDHALSPLIQAVERPDRPTLVIVTSDHGEALGDHGELTHGLFAYEATLRVPLIVAQIGGERATASAGADATARASGLERFARSLSLAWGRSRNLRLDRGLVVTTPAGHVDLVPTILDVVALAARPDLPGRSLLAALAGREAAATPRPFYFEALSANLNRGWAPLTGVLVGREKFIDLPLAELYDLAADPGEVVNLVDGRPDRRRVLEAHLRAFSPAPPTERRAESADVEARLRALGYVTGSAPRRQRYTPEDDPKRLIALDQAITRGIDLYERGRLREAAEVFAELVAARPGMALAYLHLAFLQWELGEVASALATLERAWAAGVRTPELQARLGVYLAETGSADKAVALLEPLARSEAVDADVLNALGIAYARSGNTDRALATFERLLEVDRRNAMAYENLGAVYLERGHWRAAQAAFTQALAIDPRSARAHSGLGVALLRTGDRARALDEWRQAVELDPREFDALYNLATELIRAGDRAAARPYIERFMSTAPEALYGEEIAHLRRLLGGSR